MINNREIETIKLDNGLELRLWDQSRILAGDRWLIRFEALMDIPIHEKFVPETEDRDSILLLLRQQYGDRVQYRYNMERHFVSEDMKTSLFNDFMRSVREVVAPYLSRSDIAEKILLARYRDLAKKSPWLIQ